jgi:ATP-dependent Clp protease adaptor protein ClpS
MSTKIDGFDVITDQPETRPKTKTKKPSMWNVVALNDDFTPWDFVIFIMMAVFNKNQPDAEALTMQIHVEGKGIAGTYTFEVAEMKVAETLRMARLEQHPLRLIIEPV